MNKDLPSKVIVCFLYVLFLARIISWSGAGSNLEYSQFIVEVQQGRVREVKLEANPQFLPASIIGAKAYVKTNNHESKVVNIPPGDEKYLKQIVNNIKGNIEIPTKNDWHIWYSEISRVLIPWLLSIVVSSEFLYFTTNWRQLLWMRAFALIVIVFVVIVMLSHQYFDKAKVHNPLPYAQFIKELQESKIEKVGLSPDRSRAVVDDKDGYRDIVNLPPDDRLNNLLSQNVKGKIYTIPDDRFNAIVIKNNAKVKGFKNYST